MALCPSCRRARADKPDAKLTIRMPASLHAELVQAAKASFRSLNTEMLIRLQMAAPPRVHRSSQEADER